jgi:hypothetical protein
MSLQINQPVCVQDASIAVDMHCRASAPLTMFQNSKGMMTTRIQILSPMTWQGPSGLAVEALQKSRSPGFFEYFSRANRPDCLDSGQNEVNN